MMRAARLRLPSRTASAMRGLLLALAIALPALVRAEPAFHFTVLMHPLQKAGDDAGLRAMLEEAHDAAPAFLIVNGLKAPKEACSERLYRQRKALLESAGLPVFLSLAGSDWLDCRDRRNRSTAAVWLEALREQLYGDISWTGARHMTMVRQSASAAYRDYAENTRWEYGGVMFATLHLPAKNNHYVSAAGGNGEFEDRLVADRDWLKRVFSVATRDRLAAVVLFCDGSPLPGTAKSAAGERDGFAEVRQLLKALAAQYGKTVLVVQGPAAGARKGIVWRGRLGYTNLPRGATTLHADLGQPGVFSVADELEPPPK